MLNTLRILIVEDQAAMADTLRSAFKQLLSRFPDALIVLAATLAKAKQYLAEEPPPAVIVLDLGLPDSAWQETLAQVPAFEKRAGVIIVTGHPEAEVRALLACPEVEIVCKDGSLWNNIVIALVRLLVRKSRHLEKADAYLSEVKGLLNASPAT